jgi:hypothetical protein
MQALFSWGESLKKIAVRRVNSKTDSLVSYRGEGLRDCGRRWK